MPWTNIAKPNNANWTNINTYLPIYDEPDLIYDSPSTFYDGINQSSWTNIAKPSGGIVTSILPGMMTGLGMPVTYSKQYIFNTNPWINIPKPT